jgi:hypothetical protein
MKHLIMQFFHPPVTYCFSVLIVTIVITIILPAAQGPGVYPASNRNEYQKRTNNNESGE